MLYDVTLYKRSTSGEKTATIQVIAGNISSAINILCSDNNLGISCDDILSVTPSKINNNEEIVDVEKSKYLINIIAVDFDDTLIHGNYPDRYSIDVFAIDILKDFIARGGIVILWTCRDDREHLADALDRFAKLGFVPQYVNEEARENPYWRKKIYVPKSPKVYADLYIDDRSTPFRKVDWKQIALWLKLEKG